MSLLRLLDHLSAPSVAHGLERAADVVTSPLGQLVVQFGAWWWGKS